MPNGGIEETGLFKIKAQAVDFEKTAKFIEQKIDELNKKAVIQLKIQAGQEVSKEAAARKSLQQQREAAAKRLATQQQQNHRRQLKNIQQQTAAIQRKSATTDAAMRKQSAQLTQLNSQISRFGSRMSFLLTAIVAQFVFEITTEAAGEFIKLEGSVRGLEVAASRAGAAGSQLFKQLTADVDEFNFKAQEAAESINKLLIGGISVDQAEIQKAKQTALGATVLFGTDPSKNLNDLASASLRTSRRIADNLGILVRTNEAFTKYAKTLGITKDELTGTQKSQAFWNAMLESSGAAALRAASELDTYTKEMFAAQVQLNKIKLAFGEVITAGLMPFIRTLNELDQAQIEQIASSTVMAAKIFAVVASYSALTLVAKQVIAQVAGISTAFRAATAAQAAFAASRGAALAAAGIAVSKPSAEAFQTLRTTVALREQNAVKLQSANATRNVIAGNLKMVAGLAAIAAIAAVAMAAIDNYNKRLMEVDRVNLDLAQTNIQVTGAIEALGLKFETTSAELTKIQTLMAGFNAKGEQMQASTLKATESIVNLAVELTNTAAEFDRVAGAEEEMQQHTDNVEAALARMIEQAEDATTGSEDLSEASIKVGEALKEEVLPEIGKMIDALSSLAEANVLAAMAGQTAWEQFASGFVKVGATILDTIVNIIKGLLGLRTARAQANVRNELRFGPDAGGAPFLSLLPEQPELQISQAELQEAQQALANVRGLSVETQPISVRTTLEQKQLDLERAKLEGKGLTANILRGEIEKLEATQKFTDDLVRMRDQFSKLAVVGVEDEQVEGKAKGKAAKTRTQLFNEFIEKQREALDKLDSQIAHQTKLVAAGSEKAEKEVESLEAKKQERLIEIALFAQRTEQGDLLAKETELLGQINEALKAELQSAKEEKQLAVEKNIEKYLEQEGLNADIAAGLKEFGIKVDDSTTLQSIITEALKATGQNAERTQQLFKENEDIAFRAMKAAKRELKAAEDLADAKALELARARQGVLDEDFAFQQALISSREADPGARRRIELEGLLNSFQRQLDISRRTQPGAEGALEQKRKLQDFTLAINEAATSMRDDFTKDGLATLPDLLDEVQRRALEEIDRLASKSPFQQLETDLQKLSTAVTEATLRLNNLAGIAAPSLVGGGGRAGAGFSAAMSQATGGG